MKQYTQKQIAEAISFWSKKLVINESLKDETKQKLDKAATKFAKMFGDCIKNKQVGRIEDDTKDALVAIKKTIRVNSNTKSNPMASMFIQMLFDGDKKVIDNLMKTTEQFNYFANVVFGIWHRDPELSKWLKKNLPQSAKKFDSVEEYIASLAGENDQQEGNGAGDQDNDGQEDVEDQDDEEDEIQEKEDGEEESEGNEDAEKTEDTNDEVDEGAVGAGLGALAGDKVGEIVGKHFRNPDTVKTIMTTAGAVGGAMLEGDDKIPDDEFMAPVTEEDVPENTVDDLIRVLQKNGNASDPFTCRVDGKECFIFDITSKDGKTVIDMKSGSLKGEADCPDEVMNETNAKQIKCRAKKAYGQKEKDCCCKGKKQK